MKIAAPYIHVRPAVLLERRACCDLARANWGDGAADRCHEQFVEGLKENKYAPVFIVAADDDNKIMGFAAYHRSMLMKGAFDLIWLVVDEKHRGTQVGRALTEWRLIDIEEQDGQMILLSTQRPGYFSKFGFFKLHHLGNEWYLMLKLLKEVDL